jgi:hypothetical protein
MVSLRSNNARMLGRKARIGSVLFPIALVRCHRAPRTTATGPSSIMLAPNKSILITIVTILTIIVVCTAGVFLVRYDIGHEYETEVIEDRMLRVSENTDKYSLKFNSISFSLSDFIEINYDIITDNPNAYIGASWSLKHFRSVSIQAVVD